MIGRSLMAWLMAASATAAMADCGDLQLETLFKNPEAGLERPLGAMVPADGTGRIFVVQQRGLIRVWDGNAVLEEPFLDLTAAIVCCADSGLLGLAFHPDYAVNGRFYVNFTEPEPNPDPDCPVTGGCQINTAVVEYQVSADPNVADPQSARRVLTITQPNAGHNGGQLKFGPDGYLYVGMGDGDFIGNDPHDSAQPLDQLLGKMLRLDVDGTAGGEICGRDADYGIPPDNPFVGVADACDEIWASGLRNPWRFSFDRTTGDLFIGDVGSNRFEEIDYQPASSSGGENYGWPCMEGTFPFPARICLPPPGGPLELTQPILEYAHDGVRDAVIGGFRYRGSALPEYQGAYIYGDLDSGDVFIARENQGLWEESEVFAGVPFNALWSFGEDQNGEILVVQGILPAAVHRVVGGARMFCDGFESGDLTQWADSQP